MTEEIDLPESVEQPQVANFSHLGVQTVNAELVQMHQSTAREIQADDLELSLSAAANVASVHVFTRHSALALVQSVEATLQTSAVGTVLAETVSVHGAAVAVIAGSVEMNNSYAGIIAGREVRGEKIESLILLSPRVEGNVTTIIDARGALIAGMVGGLFAGIMLLLGRMLFGRK